MASVKVNPADLRTAATGVETIGSSYSTEITTLYSKIDELGQYWKDSVYATFSSTAYEYQDNFKQLETLLSTSIPADLRNVATKYEGLESDLKSAAQGL